MFNQQPFRLTPSGPASAYTTFSVAMPHGPEFERAATCEEIDCDAWRNGWMTRVPAASLDLVEAVMKSGRPFTEVTGLGSSEREFLFAPGTPCFRASTHRIAVRPDLPQLFVVRDGDWRGNPRHTEARIHKRPEDWVENFQETTAAVVDRIERG